MMMVLSSSSLSSLSHVYVSNNNNNLVNSISSSPSSTWDHFHGRRIRIRNSFLLDLKSSRRIKQQHRLKSRCQLQLLDVSSPATVSAASYGALLLAGGLFAYTRTGSKGSLFGGLAGFSSMTVALVLMQSPETKPVGDSIAFGSSLLFTFVFGIRLAATGKAIPSGLLLGLSIGALAVFLSAYLQDTQSLSTVM